MSYFRREAPGGPPGRPARRIEEIRSSPPTRCPYCLSNQHGGRSLIPEPERDTGLGMLECLMCGEVVDYLLPARQSAELVEPSAVDASDAPILRKGGRPYRTPRLEPLDPSRLECADGTT